MRRLRLVLPLLAALAVLVPWWAARRDTANPAPAAAALNLAREQGRAIAALRADLAAYRAETARRRRDAATPRPRVRPAAPTREPAPPPPPAPDITFAHVINPMPAGHGLHADVEVTFAALARAAAYARARGVGVRLLTCEFAGEARIRRPAAFEPVANLTRHAFEAYELGRRGVAERRLPFVTEIFENAYRETEGARFLGYTNADIAVQEDFYVKAAAYAKASDAFVINRVEVDDKDAHGRPYGPADLETLYALGRKRPQRHAGYDCFFWRRDRTPLVSLFVRNVFVGYPPVGSHVMEALRCVFGTKYREIRGAHHTFHLGDRNGGWSQHGQYEHMNRRAARLAPGPFRRVARAAAPAARTPSPRPRPSSAARRSSGGTSRASSGRRAVVRIIGRAITVRSPARQLPALRLRR